MHVDTNKSNRKHYRVYKKKNCSQQSMQKDMTTIMKHKKILCYLIGMTFIKGLFWGYVLKSSNRR